MKTHRKIGKLTLASETLRWLTSSDLERAGGGLPTAGCTAPTRCGTCRNPCTQ
jgi:hypothetical protein